MKRASVLIVAILFVFIVPMAYGGGSFTTTVIKESTGLSASQCIQFSKASNDVNDYNLYNNPNPYEDPETQNSARLIFFHDGWNPPGGTWYDAQLEQPYHRRREELLQIFYAKNDANMGAVAFRLPPAAAYFGYNAPVQEIPPAGSELTVSMYKAIDGWDFWPNDHQLLVKWTALVPAAINSDPNAGEPGHPNDPTKAQAGDWLKFTVAPGYRLQAGCFYKIRFGWTNPQDPCDANATRIYFYQNRLADDDLHIPKVPGYPYSQQIDKYGRLCHGPYRWGRCSTYIADNTFTFSPGPTVCNWYPNDRDFSFGILPAAPGVKVAHGRQAGDADYDGKTQMDDFAALASNWRVDKRIPAADMNIPYPYLLDANAPNTDVIVDNNQPQVLPDPNYKVNPPNCSNRSPYVNWYRRPYTNPNDDNDANSFGLRSIAQSFKAPSTTTMGAIAVRVATGAWPVAEETAGDYTMKIYSVAGPNTVPTSGTVLKNFKGHFNSYGYTNPDNAELAPTAPYYTMDPEGWDSLYQILTRQVHQGAWLTWILPTGGVNLTAGNYYAFTLEWNADTDTNYSVDYTERIFRIDITDPCIGGTDYTDGSAFTKERNSSGAELGYVPLSYPPFAFDANDANSYPGRDLVFEILGTKKNICVNDYEFTGDPDSPGNAEDGRPRRNVMGWNAIAGDLDGDCKVDFKDVAVLAFNWLLSNVQ
jgi:hypothetical protein